MKFALNGALIIGTLDGANIEIKNEVGEDNIFIFGLKADEIRAMRNNGYSPRQYYEKNEELKKAIDMIAENYFNMNEPGIFKPIVEELLNKDFYFVLADFESYINTQKIVENRYKTLIYGRYSQLSTLRIWECSPLTEPLENMQQKYGKLSR